MKVVEGIIEKEIEWAEKRLKKSRKANDDLLIKVGEMYIEKLKSGDITIAGEQDLLQEEFKDKKIVGRGNWLHIEFDNGIQYFPSSSYGKFIQRE